MTRRRGSGACTVKATLTAYVDQQGTTLLVAAVLRGAVRLFPVETDPRRCRVPEHAQRAAGARAEAWAGELGASGVEWTGSIVLPETAARDFSAVVALVQDDLRARAAMEQSA